MFNFIKSIFGSGSSGNAGPESSRLSAREISRHIRVLASGKDDDKRCQSAVALGESGDRKAVEPLIGAAAVPSISHAAFNALIRLGSVSVEPLIGLLDHEQFFVKEGAAKSLLKLGSSGTVEPLIAALQRGVNGAIDILGDLGDPRAADPLISALNRSSYVAEAAAKALGLRVVFVSHS